MQTEAGRDSNCPCGEVGSQGTLGWREGRGNRKGQRQAEGVGVRGREGRGERLPQQAELGQPGQAVQQLLQALGAQAAAGKSVKESQYECGWSDIGAARGFWSWDHLPQNKTLEVSLRLEDTGGHIPRKC